MNYPSLTFVPLPKVHVAKHQLGRSILITGAEIRRNTVAMNNGLRFASVASECASIFQILFD